MTGVGAATGAGGVAATCATTGATGAAAIGAGVGRAATILGAATCLVSYARDLGGVGAGVGSTIGTGPRVVGGNDSFDAYARAGVGAGV